MKDWHNITVAEYRDVYKIITSGLNDEDKACELVSLLNDLTPTQVDNLTVTEFNKLCSKVAFLFKEIPNTKPVNQIKANGRRYKVQYHITNIRFAQYAEIKTYLSRGIIDNLHYLMASIVQPVTWYGKVLPNTSEGHEKRANDMLQCRFIDLYNACLFFCKVWKNLMPDISKTVAKKMNLTKEQAELLKASLETSAGFITQPLSPNITE